MIESKEIENNGEVINKSQSQKLIGVCIVYELKFDTHMKTLCQKMGKNLLTLSQVIKFMCTKHSTAPNERFCNVSIQLL